MKSKSQQTLFYVSSFCLIQSASYIEFQIIGPLADDMVTRMAVIGHLELEDVIATGSISILIEQNTRTCTSCRTQTETDRSHTERKEEMKLPTSFISPLVFSRSQYTY